MLLVNLALHAGHILHPLDRVPVFIVEHHLLLQLLELGCILDLVGVDGLLLLVLFLHLLLEVELVLGLLVLVDEEGLLVGLLLLAC